MSQINKNNKSGSNGAESSQNRKSKIDKKANDGKTDLTEFRKNKRENLLKHGIPAYPVQLPGKLTKIETIIKKYKTIEKDTQTDDFYGIAGRVMFIRNIGKLIFVRIQNGSGSKIQVMLNQNIVGKESLRVFIDNIDIGDIIYAYGKIISSKTGELSLLADDWAIASKSLKPLPVLHKELNDDTRIRNRAVELITSDTARRNARIRVEVIKALRHLLEGKGFLEIETPMLQILHGGAAAKPFSTHMNAFDMELYLRIAPELFLKRAAVGGFDKVFEINRNFRNEGADSSHSPEFSMLELYEAYSDYNGMAALTKEMVQTSAKVVHKIQFAGDNRSEEHTSELQSP
jgi:lysyl-tRNA synthetase class 2